jgi:hypothetical protein
MSQLSITSKILRLRIDVRYVGDHETMKVAVIIHYLRD